MRKIHILGAGLGGMVAAINLARAGCDVLVIDAARGIGGIRGFHPSVHVTPMDLAFVDAYTGLDFSSRVERITRPLRLGLWDDSYLFGEGHLPLKSPLYNVERGHKKTSVDAFLYNEAKKLGVKFSFSTFINSTSELPPGSIIASGLHPEIYDDLKLPFEIIEGFYFLVRPPKGMEDDVHLWAGAFAKDYYYGVGMNGLYYGLLFQRGSMDYGRLVELEKGLLDRDGHIYEWMPFICRAPTKSLFQPRLFWRDFILGGSISGMVDPLLCFGIHGAILSGRTAALAVLDRERAVKEFGLLTQYYQQSWIMRQLLYAIPPQMRGKLYKFMRYRIPDFLAKYGYYLHPVADLASKGIPGCPEGLFTGYFVPPEKEKKRAAVFDKAVDAVARLVPRKYTPEELEAFKHAVKAGA